MESAVKKWVVDTDLYMFGAVSVNHARIDPARLHDLVTTIARATAAGPLGRSEDVCPSSIPDTVDIRDFGSDEILITTVEVKKDVECLVAQCGEGVGGVLCIASGHHHDHTPEPEQEQHPDKTGHRGYRQGYGET